MKKSKFIDLINNYQDLSQEDLSELKDLEKAYPFSQVIHNLVAKASSDQKTTDAKAFLGRAAMYATDRIVLKKLIQNNLSFQTSWFAKPKQPAIQETKPAAIPEEPASKEKMSVEVRPKSPSVKKTLPDESSPLAEKRLKFSKIPDDVTSLRPSTDRAAIVALRKEVIANLNQLLALKKETAHLFSTDAKSAKRVTRTKSKGAPESKSVAGKKKPKKTKKAKTKVTPTKPAAKGNKKTSKKKSHPKEKISKSVEPRPDPVVEASDDQVKQLKMIEDFIGSSTHLKIDPKSAPSGDEDRAAKSTQLNEDMISENLAKIFVKQGKIEKAIDIYKKLIWKFPQKRAYFASQITKLKGG